MWTDPEILLELARQRQREIARAVAAHPTGTPKPAIDDVVRSWLTAVRTTRDFVRALVIGC